ncbi:MAG: hypothetical protein QOE76_3512 [Frankiales bacterium]|jgi:hypothetical protein|nr:hypothetical protein [Frankiales bacterium]MDX6245789.1 hypothetical protein [Frankiales bacterium]
MTELELLVEVLGCERALLDVLVYRLVELRALLVSGDGRFLAWAAEEVEDATSAVRAAELSRAILISEMAEARGLLEETLTLAVLVETADPPWRALLQDHRLALAALTAEVDDHASAVRRLARTTTDAVAAVLAQVGGA